MKKDKNLIASKPMLPAVFERRVSIFDVKAPFIMNEKRLDKYEEIMRAAKSDSRNALRHIEDISPAGNFIEDRPRWVRIEVDSRFVTDKQAADLMQEAFKNCR